MAHPVKRGRDFGLQIETQRLEDREVGFDRWAGCYGVRGGQKNEIRKMALVDDLGFPRIL